MISKSVAGLAFGLAAFLVLLLTRYFLPPHIPRFRVETFFIWFLAAGVIAVGVRSGSDPGVRPRSDPDLTPRQLTALAGFFAALAFLQYGAALRVGWLSDDFVLADWVVKREWVHAGETGFVRPVVPMFWAVFWYLPFSWPATLHVVNLLLHAANGLLVVAIAGHLRLDRQTALAAGVIFATFSAMAEAIVWISGMQDVLMVSLALATILSTLSPGLELGQSWANPLAIVMAAAALGVKETAVVIPMLGWLIAWTSPEGIASGNRKRTLAVMTGVAVVYAIVRASIGVTSGYGRGVSRYFFKQLAVDPFASLGEPWSAAWLQANPFVGLSRGILIVVLLAAAFAVWRRRDAGPRIAAASAAWVLLGVLPVFSFFHVSDTLEGSRYLYLPAVGFSLFIASIAGDLARRSGSASVASGLIVACVLAVAAPSLAASRAEVARWTEAARLRDQILVAYVRVMPSVACGSFVAEGRVDNIEGAYVLRNGFRQALEEMGAPLEASATQVCHIDWADHLIVRQVP